MNTDIAATLLIDMEESFEALAYVPLYELAWSWRGYGRDASTPEADTVFNQVYEQFCSTHAVRRVWSRWPIDLSETWPVDPGTPLDFDLDPEGDPSQPLQVLVPAESVDPA